MNIDIPLTGGTKKHCVLFSAGLVIVTLMHKHIYSSVETNSTDGRTHQWKCLMWLVPTNWTGDQTTDEQHFTPVSGVPFALTVRRPSVEATLPLTEC